MMEYNKKDIAVDSLINDNKYNLFIENGDLLIISKNKEVVYQSFINSLEEFMDCLNQNEIFLVEYEQIYHCLAKK